MRRSWKMTLSGGLRCCRRVLSWVPVLVIVLVVLWSYYAYVFELCLVTVLSPAEKGYYEERSLYQKVTNKEEE